MIREFLPLLLLVAFLCSCAHTAPEQNKSGFFQPFPGAEELRSFPDGDEISPKMAAFRECLEKYAGEYAGKISFPIDGMMKLPQEKCYHELQNHLLDIASELPAGEDDKRRVIEDNAIILLQKQHFSAFLALADELAASVRENAASEAVRVAYDRFHKQMQRTVEFNAWYRSQADLPVTETENALSRKMASWLSVWKENMSFVSVCMVRAKTDFSDKFPLGMMLAEYSPDEHAVSLGGLFADPKVKTVAKRSKMVWLYDKLALPPEMPSDAIAAVVFPPLPAGCMLKVFDREISIPADSAFVLALNKFLLPKCDFVILGLKIDRKYIGKEPFSPCLVVIEH